MKIGVIVVVAVLGVACTEPEGPHTISVYNFLQVPIQVSANGTAFGTIAANEFTAITVAASTETITVSPGSDLYGDGSVVPDDLATFAAPITADGEVDVSNIVNGQTYFAPRIWNGSNADVMIGLVEGPTVRCLGTLAPTFLIVSRWGYYRLTSSTTLRVYRAASNCSGPSLQWSNAQLSAFEVKTGVVILNVLASP